MTKNTLNSTTALVSDKQQGDDTFAKQKDPNSIMVGGFVKYLEPDWFLNSV